MRTPFRSWRSAGIASKSRRDSGLTFCLPLILLLSALSVSANPSRSPTPLTGRPLAEALELLRGEGLDLFFSSRLVRPDMKVNVEPEGATPAQRLEQLLRPHGLQTETGPGGRLLVVRSPPELTGRVIDRGSGEPLTEVRIVLPGTGYEVRSDSAGTYRLAGLDAGRYRVEAHKPGFVIGQKREVELAAGRLTRCDFELDAVPNSASEILVLPRGREQSFPALHPRQQVGRSDLEQAPNLGNDPLRTASSLPAAVHNEASAAIGVRGGRDDEVLVQLDGLELLAPYHLQDFDNAVSLMAPQTVETVELMPGSYPVEYGDRLGGVLDLTTVTPSGALERRLGATQHQAEMSASGTWRDQRLRWLAAGRAGSHEDVLERRNRQGSPSFWDMMAKLDLLAGKRQGLRLNALVADDRFDLEQETAGEHGASSSERFKTHWKHRYFWLTHSALVRPGLSVETVLSSGRVARNRGSRASSTAGDNDSFDLRDDRDLVLTGLKQRWHLDLAGRHRLDAGFELRRLRAYYDYSNVRSLDDPLAGLRTRAEAGNTTFTNEFPGDLGAVFVADRLELGRFEVEVGLRADRSSLTDDRQISPRLAAAWQSSERTVWRASWGIFHQSQRSYELAVGDGETAFGRAERAEHRGLGVEHRWPGGIKLSLELYDRQFTRPRPRWENLFNPLEIFPELAVDRVQIAPDSGHSSGLELALGNATGHRLSWSLAYVYSTVRDRIDGRSVPRATDQPHAFRAQLGWRVRRNWQTQLAWQYHTGWPTTALGARLQVDETGNLSPQPELGPLRAERVPDYHRLDFRLSRTFELPRGRLSAFVDLHNVYARRNVRGFDQLQLVLDADGQPTIDSRTLDWGGLIPTVGLSWSF